MARRIAEATRHGGSKRVSIIGQYREIRNSLRGCLHGLRGSPYGYISCDLIRAVFQYALPAGFSCDVRSSRSVAATGRSAGRSVAALFTTHGLRAVRCRPPPRWRTSRAPVDRTWQPSGCPACRLRSSSACQVRMRLGVASGSSVAPSAGRMSRRNSPSYSSRVPGSQLRSLGEPARSAYSSNVTLAASGSIQERRPRLSGPKLYASASRWVRNVEPAGPCIRSGRVLGLVVGPRFERSARLRTRWVRCRRVRCATGGC